MIQGHIDRAENFVAGWICDHNQPSTSLHIEIYISGRHAGSVRADRQRPDLDVLATGYNRYGFEFTPSMPLHPDDVVFARHEDSYIVQTPSALMHHLEPLVVNKGLTGRGVTVEPVSYSGPTLGGATEVSGRIITYLETARSKSQSYGPLWGHLMQSKHRELLDKSAAHDVAGIGGYLSELGKTDLAWGFFDGPDAHRAASNNKDFRRAAAIVICDRLQSLAEAIGCRALDNPEQSSQSEAVWSSPASVVASILENCSLKTLQAAVGGYWGIKTDYGCINVRMLSAFYAASRIVGLLRNFGLNGVTEIGGGAGLVAHYARKLGVERYAIVDIPTVGAVQAFTLRDDPDLVLYGEHKRNDGLLLVPSYDFSGMDRNGRDLLFNMDSLPEIQTDAAIGYLRDAKKQGYKYLLSINHENGHLVDGWKQNRVLDLTRKLGGYSLLSRSRDWLRPGYVEELYIIDNH